MQPLPDRIRDLYHLNVSDDAILPVLELEIPAECLAE